MKLKTILTLILLFSINFLFIQISSAQNEANLPAAEDSGNSTNVASPPTPNTQEEQSLNAPPIEAPGPMKVLTQEEPQQDPSPPNAAPAAPSQNEGNKIAKETCNGIDDCTGCINEKIVKVFCCTSSKNRSGKYAAGCNKANIENSK